jgi:uncharacterized iron-regulated membrane protein
VTGLPLVFHEEIDALLDSHPAAADLPAGTPPASLDVVVANALKDRPGEALAFMSFDDHEPLVYATTTPDPAKNDDFHIGVFDARTGEKVPAAPFDEGFMYIMSRLHIDLFTGLPGTLFLGLMGVLFVIAIVSGVVLYGPFMRKLDFGTVRAHRSPRLKWLDLHNLLGVTTLAWAFVVGFTGVVNTLGDPIIKLWQADQLAQIVAPYKGAPPLTQLASVDAAMKTAKDKAPGMHVQFIAFPGTNFSSPHHYAVFMGGNTPLTSKLLKPALIDAKTGELTAMRSLPWYAQALLLSQPLHFGDYGGLGLKIVWGLLDIITIAVLGSGLYLWLGRRRSSVEAHVEEVERGGLLVEPVPGAAE